MMGARRRGGWWRGGGGRRMAGIILLAEFTRVASSGWEKGEGEGRGRNNLTFVEDTTYTIAASSCF